MTEQDGYRDLRLKPWSNGYLNRRDPAERVQTCPACGEDYSDVEPCACYSVRRTA